jgi:Putative auto-transporter adhesin, head GIN domain
MNKRLFIPIIILLVAGLISGCGFQMVTGSGKIASETRSVNGFTSVTLAGIGNVYLTQGEAESVRIEAEDNLIPYFDTSVQGTTLKIGVKDQYIGLSIRPNLPVKFFVTLPRIEAVTLAGSGNIFATAIQAGALKISLSGSGDISAGTLTATNLDLQLSGSGNLSFATVTADQVTANITGSGNIKLDKLEADTINSKTAGSGNITVAGVVTGQSAEILGSGDYRAAGLTSELTTLRITGSGDGQVACSGTLNVNILGSGDVTYSGSPKMNVSIAGSGKVIQSSQ